MTIKPAKTIAAASLLMVGSVAAVAVGGAAAAAPITLAGLFFPAVGELLKSAVGHGAGQIIEDHKRILRTARPRNGKDGLPVNHDLARLVREAQCEAVLNLLLPLKNETRFVRVMKQWAVGAKQRAQRSDFMTGTIGNPELGVEAHIDTLMRLSGAELARIAAQDTLEEIRTYAFNAKHSVPEKFVVLFERDWLILTEALFADALKANENERARRALSLKFMRSTLEQGEQSAANDRAMKDCLDTVLVRCDAVGQRLLTMEQTLAELSERTPARETIAMELRRTLLDEGLQAEALNRLALQFPRGCSWEQVAFQVDEKIRRLLETPLHGRDAELALLDKFIEDNDRGLLIIEGMERSGKSALLAHWCQDRAEHVVRHFSHNGGGCTLSEEETLGHLDVQLSALKKTPTSVLLSGAALRSEVFGKIRSWDGDGKLIIVVDGLDKVKPALQAFIEKNLPVGVFVIVSCAIEGETSNCALRTWRTAFAAWETLPLSALAGDDVQSWIEADLDLPPEDRDRVVRDLMDLADRPSEMQLAITEISRDASRAMAGADIGALTAGARARIARWKDHLAFLAAAMKTRVEATERFSVFNGGGFEGTTVRLTLDRIYTGLRAQNMSAQERVAAHTDFTERPLGARHTSEHSSPGDAAAERGSPRSSFTDGLSSERTIVTLDTLAAAMRERRQMVILGEPASGKSTLLRWLDLKFAQAWLAHDGDPDIIVKVPAFQVDPSTDSGEPTALDELKLPIFVTMAEIAGHVAGRDDTDLISLITGKLTAWAGDGYPKVEAQAVVEALLREGRLMVLLDGLDEVIDLEARARAIDAVAAFSEVWASPGDASADEEGLQRKNRLVVTSRTVGYEEMKLPATWPHVVIQRMEPETVGRFWRRLFQVLEDQGQPAPPAAADTLHTLVYGSEDGSVAHLAGVPLLATLLAIIFQAGGGKLPRRRIEIYDQCVELLVAGRRKLADGRMDTDHWRRMLGPIAAWMHDHAADGLIADQDYRALLADRIRELWPDTPALEADRQARRFIVDDRNAVGLLVERGEGRFGFLHRTFQEYLAAAWIMDLPEQAISRMASRWKSPAWREPFLLALGHPSLRRSEEDRLKFFNGLLDSTASRDRSRLAMQLVSGIPEMPVAPGERIISRLISEILGGLRKTPWRLAPAILRQQILDCLYILADLGLDVFEAALCDVIALSHQGTDPAPEVEALAEILVQERWSSRRLAEAITAVAGSNPTPGTTPLYRAALRLTTFARYPDEAPDPPSDQQGPNQIHRLRAWRVKTAYAARRPYARRSADVQALLSADPKWRPVAIALFGALGDHDSARFAERYGEIAEMLHLPDLARIQAMREDPSYIRRFGIDDTIYNAAVHLDTRGGWYETPGRTPVTAEAENAITAPPAVSLLVRHAEHPTDSARLLGMDPGTTQARAALRLAAALLDEGDGQAWFSALGTWPREDREALGAAVGRAIAACSDGCYRALLVASKDVSGGKGDAPPRPSFEEAALPVELAWSLVRRLEPEVTLRPLGTICEVSERLRSERMRQALEFARSDDPKWEAAKVFDVIFAAEAPGTVIQALAESEALAGGPDALWPSTLLDLGLSSPALDWLLARHPVHHYRDFGEVWRALPFDTALKHRPAAAFAVALQVGVTKFDPAWAGGEYPPYIAGRIELALAERQVELDDDPEATVRRLAPDCEPAERFMLFDQLISLSGPRPELVDEALAAATLIDDPRDRWRALGRATRYAGARSDEIRSLILRAIASIEDVTARRRDRLVATSCLGTAYADPGVVADEPRLWWKAELMALLPDVPESPDYRLVLSVGQKLGEIASWLAGDETMAEPDRGLALDAATAEEINTAWREGRLDRDLTLNRIEIVSAASLGEARHWLVPPESPLAFACAFALLTREASPTLEIVRPLLEALMHGEDADAAMATAALTRGSLLVRRPPLESTIGEVGLETILAVATVAKRYRAEAGAIGMCFIADVLFDDAAKASELCDLAEAGDAAALFAIGALSHVNAATVAVLAERLGRTPRMRKAVLEGLASIFESSAPNVKAAVIAALQKKRDHLDADIGAWPGGGADVALAIGEAVKSAGPAADARWAMDMLSMSFVPLRRALEDGDGAEILKQMYHRRTLIGDEHIPSQHGRQEFALIRKAHGAQVIDIAAEWLADVVAKDPDGPLGGFLLFGLSEYAIDNPMLVTRAMLKHTGGRWDLDQVLIDFSRKAAPAALRLACRIGPASAELVQALVMAVATPNARALKEFDGLLDTARVELTSEALSWLIGSTNTPSAHRAYAVIRLLGTVTDNPNASARDRIAAHDALNAMADTSQASMHLIAFEDNQEGVGARDLGVLSYWILRALAVTDL